MFLQDYKSDKNLIEPHRQCHPFKKKEIFFSPPYLSTSHSAQCGHFLTVFFITDSQYGHFFVFIDTAMSSITGPNSPPDFFFPSARTPPGLAAVAKKAVTMAPAHNIGIANPAIINITVVIKRGDLIFSSLSRSMVPKDRFKNPYHPFWKKEIFFDVRILEIDSL